MISSYNQPDNCKGTLYFKLCDVCKDNHCKCKTHNSTETMRFISSFSVSRVITRSIDDRKSRKEMMFKMGNM